MKTVTKMAAQGDVLFIRRESLPEETTKTPGAAAEVVVAHSETGHNHVAHGIDGHYSVLNDVLRSFIVAKGDVEVKHNRSWDTHETLKLLADESRGETVWEIRRQREHVPEGWRIVED